VRTVELFAGGGGAALGLDRALQLHPVALVEHDHAACETLRAVGYENVIENDVRNVEWSSFKDIDLLWASPPCQAFSIAAHNSTSEAVRGAEADNNGWPWTLDAVDGCEPTWFIGENVASLTFHSEEFCGDMSRCPGCYWDGWIIPEFRKRFKWVAWVMLDAADYGVPQRRRRVFLVAGPGPVIWPKPTHRDPKKIQPNLFGETFRPWVTIRQALGLHYLRPDILPLDIEDDGQPFEMWRLDLPAPTVTARDVRGARHQQFDPRATPMTASDATWRAFRHRRLSISEGSALQGFPLGYPWQGTKNSQYRQVGNAVPPPVAQALGTAIKEAHEQSNLIRQAGCRPRSENSNERHSSGEAQTGNQRQAEEC